MKWPVSVYGAMHVNFYPRSVGKYMAEYILHVHEYVGVAVGGSLLEGRREATPLCPGLGPAWPKCDGLSCLAHRGSELT